MSSVIKATTNIILSLILGAVAFAFVAVKYPEFMNSIQDMAESFRIFLTTKLNIPVEYNVWVRFLIQDQQLVFMFFVIATRVILAFLMAAVFASFGENPDRKLERLALEEEDKVRERFRAEAEARVRKEFAAPGTNGQRVGSTTYP